MIIKPTTWLLLFWLLMQPLVAGWGLSISMTHESLISKSSDSVTSLDSSMHEHHQHHAMTETMVHDRSMHQGQTTADLSHALECSDLGCLCCPAGCHSMAVSMSINTMVSLTANKPESRLQDSLSPPFPVFYRPPIFA